MDLTSITDEKVCSFLASNIRAERIRRGYSQALMATKSGIPLRTYKRIESNGMGSIRNLIIILRTLERLTAVKMLFLPFNTKPRSTVVDRLEIIAKKAQQK